VPLNFSQFFRSLKFYLRLPRAPLFFQQYLAMYSLASRTSLFFILLRFFVFLDCLEPRFNVRAFFLYTPLFFRFWPNILFLCRFRIWTSSVSLLQRFTLPNTITSPPLLAAPWALVFAPLFSPKSSFLYHQTFFL